MVMLQKRFAYRYKGRVSEKTHYKHVITIPEETIQQLGWESGIELDVAIEKGKLVVRPKDGKRE